MTINSRQLREYVVRPTLYELDVADEATENLLLGTAAHESAMGKYIVQTNGSALGIYQVEPRTHADIYYNYLAHRGNLRNIIDNLAVNKFSNQAREEELIYNLRYATAIAYLVYVRAPADIPTDPDDVNELAKFWKRYYNTHLGAGTEQQYIDDYRRYV